MAYISILTSLCESSEVLDYSYVYIREMAEDAASGWIVGELEERKEVPCASKGSEIMLEKEGKNQAAKYGCFFIAR